MPNAFWAKAKLIGDVIAAEIVALIFTRPTVLRRVGGEARGLANGKEYKFNFAGYRWGIAPLGNRTRVTHRTGKWPHYHRGRIPGRGVKIIDGQGYSRHRPWDKFTPPNKSVKPERFWDRF